MNNVSFYAVHLSLDALNEILKWYLLNLTASFCMYGSCCRLQEMLVLFMRITKEAAANELKLTPGILS
jgi:hypothetical protein